MTRNLKGAAYHALPRTANHLFVAVIILVALMFLFPFYWMIIGTFKTSTVAMQLPPEFFPKTPTLANLQKLFRPTTTFSFAGDIYRTPITLRWFWNSLFTSAIAAFMVCVTSAMAGYSLAKKQFPLRQFIFWMLIAVMALPKQVLLVPLFIMVRSLNWSNTYSGLVIPLIGWPFGMFMMKQFCQTLPDEVLEAAQIDGSGELHTFVKIVIPLVKPAVGALAIFTFMTAWNDYFWQSIILSENAMKTIQLGVEGLQKEESIRDYGLIMAAASVATVPMLVVFLAFQKHFTQGITMGAVKG